MSATGPSAPTPPVETSVPGLETRAEGKARMPKTIVSKNPMASAWSVLNPPGGFATESRTSLCSSRANGGHWVQSLPIQGRCRNEGLGRARRDRRHHHQHRPCHGKAGSALSASSDTILKHPILRRKVARHPTREAASAGIVDASRLSVLHYQSDPSNDPAGQPSPGGSCFVRPEPAGANALSNACGERARESSGILFRSAI
jgi:hypothetical protein